MRVSILTLLAFGLMGAVPGIAAPAGSLRAGGDVSVSPLVQFTGSDARHRARRDCKPYNGPYGYYGNPWCDGGFLRPEDQESARGLDFYWDAEPRRRRVRRRH
jgi:hypothetical protein